MLRHFRVILLFLVLFTFFHLPFQLEKFTNLTPVKKTASTQKEMTATEIFAENEYIMCEIKTTISYKKKEKNKTLFFDEEKGGSGVFVPSEFAGKEYENKTIIWSVSHITRRVGEVEKYGEEVLESKTVQSIEYRIFPRKNPNHYYKANLINNGLDRDLCVFETDIPRIYYKTAKLGDPDKLKVGNFLCLLGYPPTGLTFTSGTIIGLGKVSNNFYTENYIQTDALINNGNSGGPALNNYGELVGIVNSIAGENHPTTFVIPINLIPKPPYSATNPIVRTPTIGCQTTMELFARDGASPASYSKEVCDLFKNGIGYEEAESGLYENTKAILLETEKNRAVVVVLRPKNKVFAVGDVIIEVAGKKVRNELEIIVVMASYKTGDKVLVKFKRAVKGKMVEMQEEIELTDR